MEALASFVTKRGGWILVACLILTVIAVSRIVDFGTGEVKLRLDPSMNRLIPEADKQFYKQVRRIFGSDETLLVALIAEDVFTREVLSSVVQMTRRIEQVDGVHHVVSLATALNIRSAGEELEIEPFLATVPESPAGLEDIRREALANPIYAGNLVSHDARATALVVYFVNMPEREFAQRGIDDEIARIAEEERGAAEVRITGSPHIKVATSQHLLSDLRRTLPLAIVVVCLVAFAFFRTGRGVFVPLLTVIVAALWTFGIVAWLGRSLNIVTTIVPPLILTLGFAYTVHVVAAYYDALRLPDPSGGGAMREGLRHTALPLLLTGFTTIIGFLSLTVSPIGAIREFGLFAVIGVGCALLASLTLAPALLQVLPASRRLAEPKADLFERAAQRLAAFDLQHRNMIFAGGAVLAGLAAIGIARLEVTSDLIANFAPDSSIRRDFEAVNRHLEGANPFYIVVETDYSDAFTEPANLRQLRDLQVWLREQPEIGGTTSLADYVMLINRGFNEGDPAYLTIPESQELTAQLLMFGANRETKNFVDSRYRTAAIVARARVIDSGALAQLIERIEVRLAELPPHLRGRITGNTVLLTRTIDDVSRGQVQSLTLTLVVIYVVLVALFTSFRIGFIALIPNVLPVAILFGIMGLTGVTLTATTSLIACIVLGIAVDDSIHYLTRFSADSKRLRSEELGTASALRGVLQPVTVTTVAICLGFATLTLSELRNQLHFGALASATLAFAWLLDVTLTPALASRLRIVSLWDLLTLDLGSEPQESIPLFRGLRGTQARRVALMATIQVYPPGHRVLTAGEPGDSMYVVIDGELKASVDGDSGRVELGRLRRGDIAGEIALVRGKRSADVDTVSEVRLLELTRSSLTRLGRRYPRIALQVSRNLNDTLAERLAGQTARIR